MDVVLDIDHSSQTRKKHLAATRHKPPLSPTSEFTKHSHRQAKTVHQERTLRVATSATILKRNDAPSQPKYAPPRPLTNSRISSMVFALLMAALIASNSRLGFLK